MSELKLITVTDECGSYRVYNKSDVDAAIDELKTENESLLQQNRELCLALQVMYSKEEYDKLKAEHHKERHEYIKMIAELKQKLQDQCISCPVKMQEDDVVSELKQKLEDAKATAYAESVNAGMENRRLKRALWLARALRARDKAFEYHFKNNVEMCAKWDNVHLMLMAKAEEYK